MSKISTEGKHFVQIKSTRWEEMPEKNGQPAYPVLVIEGINVNQETAEGRIFFNNQLCSGGKFQGRPRVAESIAKCIELGMKPPFSPSNTGPFPYDESKDQLYGQTCEFVMEKDEKYGMQVRYINAQRKEPVNAARLNELWKGLGGVSTVAPAAEQPKTAASSDDIPF